MHEDEMTKQNRVHTESHSRHLFYHCGSSIESRIRRGSAKQRLMVASSVKTIRLRFQNKFDEFSMPRRTRLLESQTRLDRPQTKLCFRSCRVSNGFGNIFHKPDKQPEHAIQFTIRCWFSLFRRNNHFAFPKVEEPQKESVHIISVWGDRDLSHP